MAGAIARRARAAIPAAAVVTLVLAAGSPAAVDEAARAEYRDRVEPICKRSTIANRHILRGVRRRVRRGELRDAGRQFMRASAALRAALADLKRVPPPEADRELLARWLGRIGRQADLLAEAGRALIQGRLRRAEAVVARLTSGARATNALVVGFGFAYCRFEPPRYT